MDVLRFPQLNVSGKMSMRGERKTLSRRRTSIFEGIVNDRHKVSRLCDAIIRENYGCGFVSIGASDGVSSASDAT